MEEKVAKKEATKVSYRQFIDNGITVKIGIGPLVDRVKNENISMASVVEHHIIPELLIGVASHEQEIELCSRNSDELSFSGGTYGELLEHIKRHPQYDLCSGEELFSLFNMMDVPYGNSVYPAMEHVSTELQSTLGISYAVGSEQKVSILNIPLNQEINPVMQWIVRVKK